MSISKKELEVLHNEVFETKNKWPQFNLVIEQFSQIGTNLNKNENVLLIERNKLYGKLSPFSLFFKHCNLFQLELSEKSLENRGAYNKNRVRSLDQDQIKYKNSFNKFSDLTNKNFKYILIPNLIHHINSIEQENFFSNVRKIMNQDTKLVIFEPALREIHQAPNHYLTYTPEGLIEVLKLNAMKINYIKETGSPFDAVRYFKEICKEYIPNNSEDNKSVLFSSSMEEELSKLEKKYIKNLKRKYMRCITAFLIEASITEE